MSEIKKLVGEGEAAMAAKYYETAVEHFADACKLYWEKHGDDNPDLLYLYGNAIFRFAQEQVQMFNTENVDSKQQQKAINMDNVQLEPLDEQEDPQPGSSKAEELDNHKDKAEQEGPEKDGEEENEDEAQDIQDEDDDFTTAWKIIDTCRVLYTKKLPVAEDRGAIEKKLANVYTLLGDISIEDDEPGKAAPDYASALELKKKFLPEDSEDLVSAYYFAGLAYELTNESLEDLKSALKYYDSAVQTAKKAKTPANLVTEMRQKVHDLRREINDTRAKNAAPSSSGKPAQSLVSDVLETAKDVGGLVKRKREDTKPGSSEPLKLQKTENSKPEDELEKPSE